jgi:hypothetical protein
MQSESLFRVLGSECRGRIGRHRRRRGYLGQQPAVRPPELQGGIGQSLDLIALFVHGPVMPPTQ